MNTLFLMVGLPASGKSSYIKENKSESSIVVSTDEIRETFFKDVNDQKHNGEVFNIAFNQIRKGLKSERDVWFDATNVNRKKRKNLIKSIRASVKNEIKVVCCFMATPVEICLKRNSSRERTVSEGVIDRMYKHFQVPYYADGFDKIVIERVPIQFANKQKLDAMLKDSCKIPHDNPHHLETIGNHMLLAEAAAIKYSTHLSREEIEIVCIAAKYHDIGKVKVKQFKNIKGEPTQEAHYYYHQNVGSYDFLCHYRCGDINKEIKMAMLIRLHMELYGSNNEKLKRDYPELMPMLAILNRSDKAAHLGGIYGYCIFSN